MRPVPRPPRDLLSGRLDALRAQGWRFSRRAIDQIVEHDLNPHQVVRAVKEPARTLPTQHADVLNFWRDGVLVLTLASEPQLVIGAVRLAQPPDGHARQRAKSGGSGRKMPQTNHELRQQLIAKGFHVEQTSGGHLRITHQHHPQLAVITGSTPSDRRAMANLVAHLRRSTGIDITR